jgi:DsbC/DsbD-like thiol-disulfide interchange protein
MGSVSAWKDSGPVSVEASISPAHDDSTSDWKLSVQLDVKPGWHLYASASKDGPARVMRIKLTLPDGVEAVGDWVNPPSDPSTKDLNTMIYEGSVAFVRKLKTGASRRDWTADIEVHYQACNEELCLPPRTIKRSVAVRTSR